MLKMRTKLNVLFAIKRERREFRWKEIRTLKQAIKKLTTKAGKMELDLKAAKQNLPDLNECC